MSAIRYEFKKVVRKGGKVYAVFKKHSANLFLFSKLFNRGVTISEDEKGCRYIYENAGRDVTTHVGSKKDAAKALEEIGRCKKENG